MEESSTVSGQESTQEMLVTLCRLGLDTDYPEHFREVATRLLDTTELRIFGTHCRLAEVEFYLTSADHPDPFTHSHDVQRKPNHWYFHRQGSGYRGGSFKGVDFTFSDGAAHSGILIRSLQTDSGELISGPSLVVDFMLSRSGHSRPAELDLLLKPASTWDRDSPIHFRDAESVCANVFRSARVGLSQAVATEASGLSFVHAPYRFLTEPRRIKKGRPELIRQLLADGCTVDQIQQLTGSPKAAIQRQAKHTDDLT